MKKEFTSPTSGFFMIVNKRACNSRLLTLTKNKTLSLFKKTILLLFLITLTLSSAGILTAYSQAPNITYPGGAKTYPVGSAIPALPATNNGGAVPPDFYITSTIATGLFSSRGIVTDAAGNVYFGENGSGKIYRITPQGVKTPFAGDGNSGTYNGTFGFPLTASFKKIDGMAIDASGSIYVVDGEANQIRKITAAGVVTTIAGAADGSSGDAVGDQSTARFTSPRDVAVDAAGNLYVADSGNNKIRKITFDGGGVATVSTFVAATFYDNTYGTGGGFNNPAGIMVDASGNVYVSNTYNRKIMKVTPAGDVSTFAGTGDYGTGNQGEVPALSVKFAGPRGLTRDALGNIYVVDQDANNIRKIDLSGNVTTVTGSTGGSSGSADGIGTTDARFNIPTGITTDASGNLFVSDATNVYSAGTIRKITTTGYTISPALPPGLSFNGGTGEITGTPTTITSATDYTITAHNASGNSTATVSIATTANANLLGLVLSAGTLSPTFAADVINYTASVSFENASITLTPTVVATGVATVSINGTPVISGNPSGAISLTVGDNIITTVVTNGSATKTYILTLTREKGNQTVSFTAPFIITYGAGSFAAGPTTSTAGLPVTYSLDNGNVVSLSGNVITILEVGSVTITASMAADANYNAASVTHNLTVTPKAITITANASQSKVYGSTDPTLTYSITSGGALIGSDSFTGSLSRTAGESVAGSPYAINQGSVSLSSNYNLTFVGANFSISQKPITITVDASQSKVYGSTDPTLTYSITSGGALIGSDSFTGSLSRTAGESVAGSPYAINQGTVTAGGNYNLSFVPANFSITQKPITITANASQTKVYGSTDPSLTYTLTSGSLESGDSFTGSLSRTAGESVAGSPYAINQGTVTAGGNYNLTFVPANFSITQKLITITADASQSKVYGATDPTLNYTITSGGSLIGSDSFTGSLSRTSGESVAGSPYAINQGTVTAGGNYNLSFVGANFTIFTKPIIITADIKSKIYGSTDPTLTYTLTSGSLESGDSFTGSLSRTAGESVAGSPYAISQGSVTAGANYDLSFIGANFSITQKPITITADAGQIKAYGSADPALTYTLTSGSLESGDSITGLLSRASGESVAGGPYAISQGSLTAGSNYNLSFIGADFNIITRLITITADAKSKMYGSVDPALTYTLTSGSLESGDSITGLLSRASGESVAGGPYTISQGSITAGSNYSINFIGVDFTIITKPIIITADAKSKVYGSADPALTYTLTSGSLETNDSFTGSLSRASGESVIGGPYTISQGSVTAGSNYSLNFIGADFNINKAPLTITADNKSKIQATANPIFTAGYSGFINQEDNNILVQQPIFVTSATTSSAAGTYDIIGSGAAADNYDITYANGTLTIVPAALSGNADLAALSITDGDLNEAFDPNTLIYTASVANATATIQISLTLADQTASVTVNGNDPSTAISLTEGGITTINIVVTAQDNTTKTYILQVTRPAANAVDQTISFNSIQPKTYGDAAFNLGPVNSSAGLAVTYTAIDPTVVNIAGNVATILKAGTTNIKANQAGNISTNPAPEVIQTLVVNKATLTITADNKNKTQDTANPVFTAGYSGFIDQEDSDILTQQPVFATTANTASPAGTYDITVSGASAENYDITYANGTLTVIPGALSGNADLSALTITGGELNETFDPNTLAYTASVANTTASIKVSPTVADQTASVTVNGNDPTTDIALTEGGITDISIVVTAQDNTTKTYTIQVSRPSANAADQTISFAAILPKAYGDAAFSLGTVNSSAGLAVTYTAADPAVVSIAGNVATILKAGTTVITASQAGNANFNAAPDVTQTLTVLPKAITITANANQGKVYASADPALIYSITSGALVNGDSFTGSLSRSAGETVAGGPYTINQGTLNAGSNYTLTFAGADFTINKADLLITANNKSKIYGDVFIPATTDFTTSTLKSGDTVTGVTITSTGSAAIAQVNNYPISISAATGTGLTNYNITYVPGNLTVGKAPLIIAADNKSRVQGTANPVFNAIYIGFLNGDDNVSGLSVQPTLATSATIASAAGTYAITAGGAVAANYTITYVNGTLTITPGTGSNNADLSNLSISSGSLNALFAPATLAYSASVSNITTSIIVSPTAADVNATIKVNGLTVNSGNSSSVSLMTGMNTIITEVTAQNGTVKIYTLTIKRLEANAPEIITVSNIMSPNGDGINDLWMIKDIELYPNNEVLVYDREGRIVFSEKGYNNTWNATINGSPLNTGTYYYVVNFGPSRGLIKGFITIVREQ